MEIEKMLAAASGADPHGQRRAICKAAAERMTEAWPAEPVTIETAVKWCERGKLPANRALQVLKLIENRGWSISQYLPQMETANA